MVPKSVAQNDRIMSAAISDDVHMVSWKGHGKRILVYPVDYDQQFNITCTYPSTLSNKQTSDISSAAAVGMNGLASNLFLSTVLTTFPCSVQSKNFFRGRPSNL